MAATGTRPTATVTADTGTTPVSPRLMTAAPAEEDALTRHSVPLTWVVTPATGTGTTYPTAAAGTTVTSGPILSAALAAVVLTTTTARTNPMEALTPTATDATGTRPTATVTADTGTTATSLHPPCAAHAVLASPTTSWCTTAGTERV